MKFKMIKNKMKFKMMIKNKMKFKMIKNKMKF